MSSTQPPSPTARSLACRFNEGDKLPLPACICLWERRCVRRAVQNLKGAGEQGWGSLRPAPAASSCAVPSLSLPTQQR